MLKQTCNSSAGANGGDDLNAFLDGDLFEVDNDVCLPTIFEDQAIPCNVQASECSGTAKPKCQAFPYQQANPVDLIVPEACVSDTSEPLFDNDDLMPDYARSNSDASCDTGSASAAWSAEAPPSSATSISSKTNKHDTLRQQGSLRDDGFTYLDSLDCLLITRAHAEDDASVEDLMATSNSLGTKLSQQIMTIARQHGLAHSSSNGRSGANAGALKDLRLDGGYRSKGLRLVHQPLSARPLGCTKLVKRRQLELWRNYSEHVAPWLDVTGSKRHFQHTLPLLAKAADYLHYAVLAVSSRHMELRENGRSGAESAGLYTDAVQLLLPVMQTLDTPVVAACLFLCVAEMMQSPLNLCHGDLRAYATLLELVDFNARSTGFQQAIFWSFANMIALGGLASFSPVGLPLQSFYPSDSLATATSYIRSQTWGEGYAKYAVFLTTSIVEMTSGPHSDIEGRRGKQWEVLFDLLDDWHNCRPEEMQALMSYPSILDDQRHPFPMILYGSAAAVVGNLLYHAAAILLLQEKPTAIELRKNQKSLLWHARQICGIVAENHERGSWPSVLRPLWMAGRIISNDLEREKIVEMLDLVQKESGWVTSWHKEDLRRYWCTT